MSRDRPPRAHDWRADFDRSLAQIDPARAYAGEDNARGGLGWGASYLMIALAEMYLATDDPAYLAHLVTLFDRVLEKRDDRMGRADAYAGKPLAGWGSTAYSDGKWHVWIVHTGMLLLGPALFVRAVAERRALRGAFGAKADEYRARIEESLRDADPYWRPGPARDEGAYFSPHLKAILPLNQQNVLGSVLLEMAKATGDRARRDRAAALARFFKNRLREPSPALYDWAYWPREREDGRGSEDISHAGLNVDFAARCAEQKLLFSSRDAERFARTWLEVVKRADGTYAGEVSGKEKGDPYLPYAAGIWLSLARALPPEQKAALWNEAASLLGVERAHSGTELVGVAYLHRFARKPRRR